VSSKKKKPYHHGDLRTVVLQLAIEALEKEPPEDLTLRDLSKRAGVSPMALYRHFADKEALLSAVASLGFEDLGRRMQAVDEGKDARSGLVAIGVTYVRFAVEQPGMFKLMYGGKPPDSTPGPPSHPAYAALTRRVSELVQPRQQAVAILTSWSLVHGLATLLVTNRIREPVPNPAAIAEQVCQFLIGAFDTKRKTRP
jgi:AcrR family transcriptional regulator